MRGRHTITEDELNEWLKTPQWKRFAGSHSNVSNKSLEIDAASSDGPVFRVTDWGTTTFLGTDRQKAISAYNDAP